MLREIVERAIELQPDMELISMAEGDFDMVRHRNADVAIVAEPPAAGGHVPEALLVNPRIKVIVLTDEGRSAHVVELCQHPVVDVSPQGLVNAIRAAVDRSARNERGSS